MFQLFVQLTGKFYLSNCLLKFYCHLNYVASFLLLKFSVLGVCNVQGWACFRPVIILLQTWSSTCLVLDSEVFIQLPANSAFNYLPKNKMLLFSKINFLLTKQLLRPRKRSFTWLKICFQITRMFYQYFWNVWADVNFCFPHSWMDADSLILLNFDFGAVP